MKYNLIISYPDGSYHLWNKVAGNEWQITFEYTHDKETDCSMYTDEAQDRFNTLHDMIEQTIGSYLLNEEQKQ
jgi:hypothetical protein